MELLALIKEKLSPKPKCNYCHGTGWGDRYYCDFYGWNRLPCNRCNPKDSEGKRPIEHPSHRENT